jgi:pimeloyl-ACP methyl ester carboxylesterase
MLDGDGFFDRPFPSAYRTRDDGTLDWGGFPSEVPLLEQYLAGANALVGAGTTAPIWVRFDAPIDPTRLPAPSVSTADGSPVLLVNVDPRSPWRGERVPVETEWLADAATYLPGNLLAVKPLHGWPLRATTRYALVLREPLVRGGTPDPNEDSPERLDVLETLRRTGIDPETTSAVVPFTTQDPTAELRRMVWTVRETLGKVPLGGTLAFVDEGMTYTAWEGHAVLPDWQSGDRPFRQAGGAFVFDADGTPRVQRWERVRFTLAVPKGPMPPGGWPIALYSHGTGGDDRTLLGDGRPEGEATILCREGIAVLGVSQPLHGDRAPPGTNAELDSFNFLNIEAARHNFRQGALDVVYLAELLAMGPTFATSEGEIRLDPEQMVFVGHSQGGLVGALAAPWMRDRVRAAVLSGAGGGLAYTVVLRKDPLDFAALVASAAGFAEGEAITPGHPVVGLIQSLAEVTDPINTAPGWFAEQLPETRGPPLPVLLTEGLLDAYTPAVTAEALAAAAHVPIVGTPVQVSEGLRLRGDGPDTLPARGNATAWDGSGVTAGLAQFAEDGHYAIYDNRRARTLYKHFATSALTDDPVLGE